MTATPLRTPILFLLSIAASALLLLLGAAVGALAAAVAMPALLPGLSASLIGQQPKAYWYLSRASGFAAYGLLWLSMASGLVLTNKMARIWPGGPTAFDLHQYTSLLGLAFALFHGLILMGDHFINYTLAQLIIPFASINYRPLAVGVGQTGFYLLGVVTLSFYVRRHLSHRAWRVLHGLSFVAFLFALVHGLASGTDSASPWVVGLYWATGGSVLFLTIYRLLVAGVARRRSEAGGQS